MLKKDIIHYLIYLYLILKPFYIFSSGSIQIADCFIVLAFLALAFAKKEDIKEELQSRAHGFFVFVICVIAVSVVYSAIYFRTDFLTSALFYVFNLMGVLVLFYCMENKEFLKNSKNICILNLIIQVAIYFFGLGKWYGTVRYMGTFNDPNQFAFFIFSSIIIIFIIENILSSKKCMIAYLLALFFILESGSTGVLLGVLTFIIGVGIYICSKIRLKKHIVKIVMALSVVIPLVCIICLTCNVSQYIEAVIENNIIIDRISEKLQRADDEEGNLLQERGYDKILKYPYKIILGAGHGYNERYDTYHTGEIHATFPSILFYYGIIPFIILLRWIWKNIKNTPITVKIAYAALLVESLTLLNERQILFWFIIILGSLWTKEGRSEAERNVC